MKTKYLLVWLLLLPLYSQAQEFRKYTNNFLYQGVDARGRAMGNAIASSSEDAFAGYWNPAGLVDVKKDQTQVGYVHVFDGLYNFDVVGVAFPTNKKHSFGLTGVRYGVDDIPNTIFLVDASGNINPDNITTFSAADYGVFLSYARELTEQVSIGGSAKFVHRNVGEFADAWGAGIDIGLKVRSLNERFKAAAFARDIFGTYTSWDFQFNDPQIISAFQRTGNDLPEDGTIEATSPSLVLAANYLIGNGKFTVNPEINVDFTFDGERNTLLSSSAFSGDPHAGVEFGYEQQVFLRAGINNVQEIRQETDFSTASWQLQPSVGGGLKLSNVEVDYALTQYDLREELTHLIAFKFGINK